MYSCEITGFLLETRPITLLLRFCFSSSRVNHLALSCWKVSILKVFQLLMFERKNLLIPICQNQSAHSSSSLVQIYRYSSALPVCLIVKSVSVGDSSSSVAAISSLPSSSLRSFFSPQSFQCSSMSSRVLAWLYTLRTLLICFHILVTN